MLRMGLGGLVSKHLQIRSSNLGFRRWCKEEYYHSGSES